MNRCFIVLIPQDGAAKVDLLFTQKCRHLLPKFKHREEKSLSIELKQISFNIFRPCLYYGRKIILSRWCAFFLRLLPYLKFFEIFALMHAGICNSGILHGKIIQKFSASWRNFTKTPGNIKKIYKVCM